MCKLAELFYDIALWFEDISEECMSAKYWFWDFPGLGGVGDIFSTLEDLFFDIYWDLRTAAFRIDDWYDDISDIWSYLDDLWDNVFDYAKGDIIGLANIISSLWDYVYDTLVGLVNAATELATSAASDAATALSKAVDAYNYAFGWLTDRANEAWTRAGEVWGAVTNWCLEKAVEAYNKAVWAYDQIALAVEGLAANLVFWLDATVKMLEDWVNGLIADVRSWALGVVEDAKAWVLASIAGPINLINLWFDDIQDFFNDPPGWLWGKVWSYLERYW